MTDRYTLEEVQALREGFQLHARLSLDPPHLTEIAYRLAEDLEAALMKVERLRYALEVIRNHRKSCRDHDADMGHEPRDFDIEDIRLMEAMARAALSDPTP